MALNRKNNENKKYMFKEGSNPLFPISNSAIKLNIKTDSNRQKRLASNDINNLQNRKFIENSSGIKIFKEINKTSSSRPKDENLIYKSNKQKLSKINTFYFSPKINDNNINQKRALLSANKIRNKTCIDFDESYKNKINIISSKDLGNSQIINKNNIYNFKKPNNKNNIIEITNSTNNSYYKNIIINNNSSTNINPNPNFINQKNVVNNQYYLKTEINKRGISTPKESNIKLIFNNKNIFGKKEIEPPIILKKKDSSLPLNNNKNGNNINIKSSMDKNAFNGEYKLHLKKPSKKDLNQNNIINMNLHNYINIKSDEQLIEGNNYKQKKAKIQGPEDLHFYFIQVIQEGKQNEVQFEKD